VREREASGDPIAEPDRIGERERPTPLDPLLQR